MDKKKVTALDVAKLAGVSQPTVSRVFSSGMNVKESKRERVLAAAKQLGYQPNALARGLTTRKTKMIGIVMREVQNPFYPEVLEKLYEQLSEKGYHIIFISSINNQIQEKEIRQLIEYSVEGVIITDALLSSNAAERFVQNDIKVVLFNRYIQGENYNAVFCDNYSAGYQIGRYLLNKGHRKVAFISGPLDTSTTIDRKNGFEKAFHEIGIVDYYFELGNYSYDGGFQATFRLLDQYNDIDAIFCGNDITAFGAIDAARGKGLLIPDDISIIGFDDVKMSQWVNYSLTTWKQPIVEMVKNTIEILLNQINEGIDAPQVKTLKGELIERNTVLNRNNSSNYF
ncbi:LacI family DNA-binding transcriptional regulator [Metabacillus bambusae]|uniref:LacI family DNA-binding transcriptional regulator n=1 Tax=Metabacillus bambusae TaxID=2795218 RepID=A0ABS3MZR2_9BACI|nr:LacI family DNA-binding transcriptional regulator [Metabacillus bambusae]MBO1511502.1 LacI family DNA-binding transcriptional regulator [Metabacillus bambusae]